MDLAPKAPPYSHRRDLILSGDPKDLEKYLSGLLQELRARDDDLSLALSLETVGGVEGDLTDFFYTETEVDTWRSGTTQVEMAYVHGITSDIQNQLDARCLESVFGTSIGTGLLLDGTVLKASAVLQKYHGIDPSANVQTMLGSANNAAIASNIGLGTEDSPTFTDLTLSGLTASQAVLTDGSKKLISRAIGIADTNILRVDGTANSGEHAVFASSGLAGLTDTELIDGLSGDITGSQSFDWNMAWMDNVQRLRGCDDHHLNLYANYLATAGTEKDIIFWTLDEGNNVWVEVFRCDANGAAPVLKMAKVLNMNSQKLTTLPAPSASGEAIRQTATITEAALGTAIGNDHVAITLNASATTGGLGLSTQEITFRAATNAQTGYATAAHITAIEAASAHVAAANPHTGHALESVLGTSIGTGLLLDTAVLKASAILQKYHGIDPSANVQSYLGAANYAAMMALLTGQAGAAFSWNSQNLTSVGTIGCGAITTTGNIVVPANGVVGVTDGNPQIVFDNANNWLEITGTVGIGASPSGTLTVQTAALAGITPTVQSDELILINDGDSGLTIDCPDVNFSRITFGCPTDNSAALIRFQYSNKLMQIGTAEVTSASSVAFMSGNLTEAFRIDSSQNLLLGTTTSPTANGGKVLSFGDNSNDPTMGANVCGAYGKDVTGTVELYGVNEADAATELTSHAFIDFQPDPKEDYPWSFYSRHGELGKSVNVDMTGAIRAIEELSGKKFIYYKDIPVTSPGIVVKRRNGFKRAWVEENTTEVRVLKNEAVEQVEVEVKAEEVESEDTKWRLEEDGDLHYYKVPIYAKATELKWQLKEGVRLDEENGHFYKTVVPSEEEAEEAAMAGFTYKAPAWLEERMNQL